MQRTLVLFDRKNGSTEQAAKILALILGPAKACPVDKFGDHYMSFDLFIIGTALYSGEINPKIAQFIQRSSFWLKDKKTALFCICMDSEEGETALGKLSNLLGPNVIGCKAFAGKTGRKMPDGADSQVLKVFYEKTGLPGESVDLSLKEDIVQFALEIKRARDLHTKRMPSKELKLYVEEFLKRHNTCTLATASGDRVRATPIEYCFHNGKLYLLSEGGEKFGNILLNGQVSLAVYDDYKGMDKLAGMQIAGRAFLVGPRDHEYREVLRLEGHSPEKIAELPFEINMIRIEIERVEFLNADFKKMGQDVRQILLF